MRQFLIAFLFGTAALTVGCGGGGSNTTSTATKIVNATQNVQPIVVDGGPPAFVKSQGAYANGAFVTITICVPGTTTCNTIDHVLVDTGSFGLRILSASSGGGLNIALPTSTVAANPLAECIQFVDTSFLWGPVATADVKIAGEVASSVPVNVVGDTTFSAASPVPATCSNGSTFDDDTLDNLGANGVLGVGFVRYDCGNFCTTGTPPTGIYYSCPSSGCVPTLATLAQQVQNPVSLFAADNNGVIIELPAASGVQPNLTGSMVFGIGTQSNNALGTATVLNMDSSGNISAKFNGFTMPNSFLDSGSNGLFFDDSSITDCASPNDFFYCPLAPSNLTAVNTGTNAVNSTVTFSVTNADNAFNTFPGDAVFPGLAGKSDGTSTSFDFGLPFFYGKNVYTSIAGTTAPGGQTPYWAY